MKIKITALIATFLTSATLYAHCPTHFEAEKVCLMLESNLLYIYSDKKTHDGPYQDLKHSSLESFTADGKNLKFSKTAKGVFKIEEAEKVKLVEVEFLVNKTKLKLKVKAE